MNPVQIFAEWYRRQDYRLRINIAFLVGNAVLPVPVTDLDLAQRFQNQSEEFERWLAETGGLGSSSFARLRIVGCATLIREMVSMLVFPDRSADDFEAENALRELRRAQAPPAKRNEPELQPVSPAEVEARMAVYQSWSQLCEGPLSNETISGWFQAGLVDDGRQFP